MSFLQDQYLIWDDNVKLNYTNFKGKPSAKSNTTASTIHTEIRFVRSQTRQQTPIYSVINRMDQNKSWYNRKDADMLAQKQLQFDISELYARKIRKKFDEMKKKKISEESEYKNVVVKHMQTLSKINSKYQNLLAEQPKLLELVNKSYQDSLKNYQEFSYK